MENASKAQWQSRNSTAVDMLDVWLDESAHVRAVSESGELTALAARAVAGVLLLVALPAIALAVLLVHCTSRGPAIYRQVRLGARGKRFVMYKIRTMVCDAETHSGPVWASPNDSRVTPLGRVLRAIGWDELPQLVNIFRGDMAFVGPRPERPEIAASLAKEIPGYYRRITVRPGITGLAQINLAADAQVEDVCRKLHLDLEYIDQASPLFDLRIVLATLPRLLGCRGTSLAKCLGVWRARPAEPVVLQMRIAAADNRRTGARDRIHSAEPFGRRAA